MTDSRRIRNGLLAYFGAIATRILMQFATLPILFAFWHAEQVGTWLAIFAIPSYVMLVGTGFAAAGGSAALIAAQEGRIAEARADFRASWGIAAIATGTLALVFAAGSVALVPALAEGGGPADNAEIGRALAWLALYIFASSQIAVLEIPFRIAGRYPDYIQLANAASLAEIGVIALCVTQSDSLATLAMALAGTRSLFAAIVYLVTRRAAPQILANDHTSLGASLRKIWKPSLALTLMPLVYGLNLQGYLLTVGAAFGAVALASFAATRVLTRLLDLLTNLNYAMQFYEAGYLAEGKIAIQRRMLATSSLVALAVSAGFGAILLLAGPWVQDWYTLGQTQFDVASACVLLVAAALRALAAAPSSLLTADNLRGRVVLCYIAGSALALGIATALAFAKLPLAIVLVPLVLAEASQTVPAFVLALRRLGLDKAVFLESLWSRERIDDVTGFVKALVKPH